MFRGRPASTYIGLSGVYIHRVSQGESVQNHGWVFGYFVTQNVCIYGMYGIYGMAWYVMVWYTCVLAFMHRPVVSFSEKYRNGGVQ